MPKKKKKQWNVPLLTVVVRGKAEEGVLVGCKGAVSGAVANYAGRCDYRDLVGGGCIVCLTLSAS